MCLGLHFLVISVDVNFSGHTHTYIHIYTHTDVLVAALIGVSPVDFWSQKINSPHFVEPESSLPDTQGPATGSRPKSRVFSQRYYLK